MTLGQGVGAGTDPTHVDPKERGSRRRTYSVNVGGLGPEYKVVRVTTWPAGALPRNGPGWYVVDSPIPDDDVDIVVEFEAA